MTLTYELDGNLYINITNKCPNRCDFCIRNESDSIGGNNSLWLEHEPDFEEIKQSLLQRDLNSYGNIVFCGFGEPCCRLELLFDVARFLKSVCTVKLRVNTNGQADLIYGRSTAADFAGLIDIVSVSLNASNAKKYDEICHSEYGEAAFDAMLKFTAEVKKYVPEVVMSVVDTIGEKEIELCRKVCESTGATFRVRKLIV